MKKILTAIIVLSIGIGIGILLLGKKQTLPVPEYPLNADSINIALQEWGLSCTQQEDDWVREARPEQSLFGFYSTENEKFVVSVSSGEKDGERILFVTFPPFNTDNTISATECKKAIVFATSLFGGFESKHQVYNNFISEYDTVNTERVKYEAASRGVTPMREGGSRWESNIGGIFCRIDLVQPILSEPQEYLSVISFSTNWDTFYPEKNVGEQSTE